MDYSGHIFDSQLGRRKQQQFTAAQKQASKDPKGQEGLPSDDTEEMCSTSSTLSNSSGSRLDSEGPLLAENVASIDPPSEGILSEESESPAGSRLAKDPSGKDQDDPEVVLESSPAQVPPVAPSCFSSDPELRSRLDPQGELRSSLSSRAVYLPDQQRRRASALSQDTSSSASTLITANGSSRSSSRLRKQVSFHNLEFREYGITLGDHPATTEGPPVTLEWQPITSYSMLLDDYESQIMDCPVLGRSQSDPGFSASPPRIRRRSGLELRMPAQVREALLGNEHTPADMKNAALVARRVRMQRQATYAFSEFESTQQVLESTTRQLSKLFRSKKKNAPEDPSKTWLKQYKKEKKLERKNSKLQQRKRSFESDDW